MLSKPFLRREKLVHHRNVYLLTLAKCFQPEKQIPVKIEHMVVLKARRTW